MPIELITNRNLSEGLHVFFIYINDITGGVFINLLLFVIWASITFGIYFTMKRTSADADFMGSLATGGFVTSIITIMFSFIEGLVNGYTIALILILSFSSVMMWFFNRN